MTFARPIRVAILDDDQSIGSAISRLLRASNIEAKAYVNCVDLFNALASNSPNCLLLDLQMPDMSGLDVMHYFALRGIEIPTIVITAHDAAGTRELCIEAGAKGYLCKPLDGEELLLAIRNVSGADSANSGGTLRP